MTAGRRKGLLILLTVACTVGAGGLIRIGYDLFHNRTTVFVLFSIYAIILAGIVLFFGIRLIDFHLQKE